MYREAVPYSVDDFNDDISRFMRETCPQSILDIGPGAGKYGKMARQLKADGVPIGRLEAIEIDQSYVEHFRLREVYDFLEVRDATTLPDIAPDAAWDLVILGDVLEHFRKSRGVDLIDYLYYRARHILLIIPVDYVQGAWEGRQAEAHISTWYADDFARYGAEVSRTEPRAGLPGGLLMVKIKGLRS